MAENQKIMTLKNVPVCIDYPRNTLASHCLKYETDGTTQARYSRKGAIRVLTGARTGRSQDARYFVRGSLQDHNINWNNPLNQGFDGELFVEVWQKALFHASNALRPLFLSHLYVGADHSYAKKLRVYTRYAWHAMFARNMFIEYQGDENLLAENAEWKILNDPSFLLEEKYGVREGRGIFVDFIGQNILLAGMHYGGEMKKAVFTMMNATLPRSNLLTMHCAANVGLRGDTALYFALSGGGKTTLSADPERFLIGDDEHVWSDRGISNLEGGCYAKGIGVSPETEPDIYHAISDGVIIENADLDPYGEPILIDPRIENVRISYDRSKIKNLMPGNAGGHPKNIFFLTRDAYGILPPVSKLSINGARYHFANAYTTEGGGTVMGMEKDKVKHKFSFGYGAAFLPLHYRIYLNLLERRLDAHKPQVWLVNTGWYGGPADGNGRRYPLKTTRRIIHAALSGELRDAPMTHLPELNLDIPTHINGVDDSLLNPENAWSDKNEYRNLREKLIGYYLQNHEAKFSDLPDNIRAAGPKVKT